MLHTHLKIPVKDQYFVLRRTRHTGWDGTAEFFNIRTHCFSIGLWPHVRRWLKANGYKFNALVAKHRSFTIKPDANCLQGITLRSHQLDAVSKWLDNRGAGLIWSPAGSGKTEIACCAIKLLTTNKLVRRTLFVVNSLDLVNQTIVRIKERLGVKAGSIASGKFDFLSPIVVASIQSLDSILKKKKNRELHKHYNELKLLLETIDFIVYDEVHHARSNSASRLIRNAKALRFKLGLSAQPFHKYDHNDISKMTAEDVRVLAALGPIAIHVKSSDLIEKGRLARPTLFFFPVHVTQEYDWNTSKRVHLFENKLVHDIVRDCVFAASRAKIASLVIAGNSRRFGRSLHKHLQDWNINAVNLHGSVNDETRDHFRSLMNKGKLNCIIATTIYDEGVDLPDIKQLILANGGLSAIKIEQRIGRGLRRKSFGVNAVVIIDFMFYGNRYLRRHSLARLRRYMAEEAYEIKLVGPAEKHTPYVRKLLKDRCEIGLPPSENTFRQLYGNDNSRLPDMVRAET